MENLVSVIIPTKNRAALLKRAIQSVLSQTIQNFEIIVIDDASTDETPQLLASFRKVIVITNTFSVGGSRSRNLGINKSKGKWIAFLDDDDVWRPEKLAMQLRMFDTHPDALACTSGYRVNYPMGIKRKVFPPAQITLATLLETNSLGGASVCICKTSILKEIGGFDDNLMSAQDWDLWVKLCMRGQILVMPALLVDYFVHLNYRISNNMRAKYLGARRFYFKYQSVMSEQARVKNLAFICFIKSRQSHKKMVSRLRYLFIAKHHSERRVGYRYIFSSLPRIILQPFYLFSFRSLLKKILPINS